MAIQSYSLVVLWCPKDYDFVNRIMISKTLFIANSNTECHHSPWNVCWLGSPDPHFTVLLARHFILCKLKRALIRHKTMPHMICISKGVGCMHVQRTLYIQTDTNSFSVCSTYGLQEGYVSFVLIKWHCYLLYMSVCFQFPCRILYTILYEASIIIYPYKSLFIQGYCMIVC